MRIQKLLLFFFIYIVFVNQSCNTKSMNDCLYSVVDLLNEKSKRLVIIDKENNIIHEARNIGLDSLRDGEYYFYDSGQLKSFYFFGSQVAYTYKEEFDKSGNTIAVEGNPLVYKKVKEIAGGDSLDLKLYLFTINKKYLKITIQVNESNKMELPIITDTIYLNMKLVKFGFRYDNLDSMIMKFEVLYEDCKAGQISFKDSLKLYREIPESHLRAVS